MQRILALFFLLIAGWSLSPVFAQDFTKLDPRFRALLGRELPDLKILSEAPLLNTLETWRDGKPLFAAIIYSKNAAQLYASGIPLNTIHKNFATARLTLADLLKLAQTDGSFFVVPAQEEHLNNDLACGASGAALVHNGFINNTAYRGQNVLVCIIDTGIDWTHKNFRSPSDTSSSRILYIWDQTLLAGAGESTPGETGCNYGVEYGKAQIDNELDGTPAGYVREKDTNGHGTHVAGTAAGNGYASPDSSKYAGAAPAADLLIVKAGNGSFSTTNLVDAISYARQKATSLGKAVVINLSIGSDAGSHDGTDAKSQAINAFCGAGRAAVLSAGNSGESAIHISATVAANDSSQITFTVPSYTANTILSGISDNFIFDLWTENDQPVTARVITPNGYRVTQAADGYSNTNTNDGYVYLDNNISSQNNDRNVFMYIHDGTLLSKNPVAGAWTLRIKNSTAQAITWHGWLYDYTIGTNGTVTLNSGNTDYTLSNTAGSAVIVASYVHRWMWQASDGNSYSYGSPNRTDNISSFSSKGPTRTGEQKPDVAAPGQGVASARSKDITPSAAALLSGGKHHIMQGTSMSAPTVTGLTALLLQQNNSRTATEVRTLLTQAADQDSYTGSVWNATWGFGKVNIFDALVQAVNADQSSDKKCLQYDLQNGDASRTINSGEKIAVRFSPDLFGRVAGCFFHPSSSFSLTGPACFEIWSDNGSGRPLARIGQTKQLAAHQVLKTSWNYVDLLDCDVMVEPGQEYHMVLYGYNSSDSYTFRHDNGDPTGRSSIYSGSSWSAVSSYDFRMRIVIARRGVLAQTKLYLQGPYDTANHRMTTLLNSGHNLPLTSPYSQNPRTVTAIPANAVDWVLLQLKSTPSGSTLVSQSVFIDKNGRLVSDDGLVDKVMLDVAPADYFVTIRHRNHFITQSSSSHTLNGNTSTLYDFSTAAARFVDANAAHEVESGIWSICSGDLNQDGLLTTQDYLPWYRSWLNSESGYRDADVNLDGTVGTADYEQWLNNAKTGARNELP